MRRECRVPSEHRLGEFTPPCGLLRLSWGPRVLRGLESLSSVAAAEAQGGALGPCLSLSQVVCLVG